MGIRFKLERRKSKGDQELPEIEAYFTNTEYQHFLDRLAESAGFEKQWKKLRRAELRVQEDLIAGRELEGAQPHPSPELKAKVDRRIKRLLTMTDDEPLLLFLIMPFTTGALEGKNAAAAAKRLREVVDDWEPTPSGLTGWREMALELVEAMELAAEEKLRFVLVG